MNLFQTLFIIYFIRQCVCLSALDYPATLYTIPTPFRPAFLSLLRNPLTGEIDLAYSSFTGLINDPDKVLRIPSVSLNYNDKSKMQSHLVTQDIIWPNEVGGMPLDAFTTHYWTSSSAFFLPKKDNGSISLIDMSDPYNVGEPIMISPVDGDKMWYYHRVLWKDMDYDGDYDAITARAYGNATATFEAELVWFENPGTEKAVPNWNTHVIHAGEEDVLFRMHNFPLPDGGETLVIVSAGFFRQALTLTWTTDGNWSNPDSIQHRIIDNYGWYFDCWVEDLNGDGALDIIATTWSRPEVRYFGSIVAYEMPDDWRTGRWQRRVISRDFRNFANSGKGTPGSFIVFWPSEQMKIDGKKPHIILSGDDDGHAYLLLPESQDPAIWDYKQSVIFRTFRTVGGIAIADIDEDGFVEVFVPGYESEQIIVMSYRP